MPDFRTLEEEEEKQPPSKLSVKWNSEKKR